LGTKEIIKIYPKIAENDLPKGISSTQHTSLEPGPKKDFSLKA